jgi:hypothetical protein
LKPFYEGWTTEITASMELAEPIYKAWTCDVSSQWHKTKALTGRQPSTKKNQICFLFPLSFIFCILFYFCHSLIFLFFHFNIEDNVVFKVWGYWENFVPRGRSVMVKGLRSAQQVSSSSQGLHLL